MKHIGALAYIAALGMTIGLLTTGCAFHGSFGADWYGKTYKQERSELLPRGEVAEVSESKKNLRY